MSLLRYKQKMLPYGNPMGGGGGGGGGGKGGGSVVPVLITVVAVVATVYAGPAVGAAIMESMGTTAAAIGVSEAVVGGAAIAGSTSAVNAAVQGKDVNGILEAGAKGAAAGAVGGAVGGAAGGGVGGGAAGGAASGATSAALNKRDPVTGALIGAAGGAVAGGISEGLADPNIGDAEAQQGGFYGESGVDGSTGASPELVKLLSSTGGSLASRLTAQGLADTSTRSAAPQSSGYAPTATDTTAPPPTAGPGTAALGQALRVGSGEPGAPVESPGGGEKTSRNVWNLASLRTKDETGGE